MQHTTSDDVIIDYNIYGNGDTTLLFIHGACIDQTYWAAQVPFFENDYKVVTLDLPGHGKSGHNREQYSLANWGSDVVWMMKLLELKNVVLIGHSMGGSIIMHAAVDYPEVVKGFVSVDFFKNVGQPLPKEYQEQSKQIEKDLETDFSKTNAHYAGMFLVSKQTPTDIKQRIIDAYKNADPKTVRDVMPELFGTNYKDEQQLLPQLPVKLYAINADYMPTNEKALDEYCKNGYEVINMHATSHYPMMENPDEFNKKLAEVLGKL
jgi:sigma-B regulation protein RsbQ